jgi:parallel beta-helix repeat protein
MDKVRLRNYFFTCLLVIICGLLTFSGYATTYYVSNIGNDSNSGLTTALPWKTLTKVNAFTFKPGDQILFQRGSTFYGTLTINSSGSSGSPITYGAYGIGTNPVITGFTKIISWTNLGSNIWESTNAVSTLPNLNIVTINGVNTAMGRTPNAGSVYTAQTHNANISVTSNNLNGTPNWTGAQVVIRKNAWTWQVGSVTSQSGGTVYFSDEGKYTPCDNCGFFFQADSRTLDIQNEWYYNPTTKKIRVYSTSQPVNVAIPTVDILSDNYGKNYINVNGLTFQGANLMALKFNACSNINISNCIVNKIGLEGIYFYNTATFTINANTIKNCNYSAVFCYGGTKNTNETITNNTIDSTYMILGVGRLNQTAAIHTNTDVSLVQYNTIQYSGYDGIMHTGQTGQVRNNYINYSLLNRSDGGGIYTTSGSTNLVFDGNVILNSIGYPLGEQYGYVGARGIYLDSNSANVTVSNNTIAHCWDGIYLSSGTDHNTITGNTVFDNTRAALTINNPFQAAGSVNSNIVSNNKFIAKSINTGIKWYNDQMCLWLSSSYNDINTFISSASGNCYARPLSDTYTIKLIQPDIGTVSKKLEEWQTFSGKDASSTKSPQSISSESDLQFEYNATKTTKTITLSKPMIDVKGIKYTTSVTLQSYTSTVLIKDSNPDLGDLINPVINGFSIPASSTSLTVPITTLSASDNIGVTGYLLTESSTKPSSTSSGWSIIKPSSYTFSSSGAKTLYVWAKDLAGNISASISDQVIITLSSAANTLGNTEVYSQTSTDPNRRAIPVTFSETGSIQSISIYHNGGTGNVLLGVYTDQSGNPSTQLGVTSSTIINTTSGWQTVSLTNPVSVTAGQTVWLAWVFQNNPGVRYTTGFPGRAQSSATWTGGMPTTFGTSYIYNNKYSIYCTYIVNNTNNNLGNTEVYSQISTDPNRRAMPFTFSESGSIQSISIYHNGGSGNVILGVYSDQSGTPSTQLGVTSSTVINTTAGWQTVTLSAPVDVSVGQTVWLAWVFQNNPGVRYTTGFPGRAQSSATWTGGMPITFGTSYIYNNKYSIYCTYTVNTTLKNATIPEIANIVSISSPIADDDNEVKKNVSDEGLIDLKWKNDFKLYPNPAKSFINVDYTNIPEPGTIIEIVDGSGRAIFNKLVESEFNRIDTHLLKSGIYIIRSIYNQQYNIKKLIIQ